MAIVLNKLSVKCQQGREAEVSFGKGLNVITGPSDTGKSYIFNCINFVMGSSTVPKKFDENIGYTDVYLQFTSKNKVFTIKRTFDSENILLFEGGMEEFDSTEAEKLSVKHSQNKKNISKFFLNEIGFKSDVQLKKDSNNKKASFSLRYLKPLFMVNEEDIISTNSPFHSNNVTERVVEKSLWKFILTGQDDSLLETVEKLEITKAKIASKIEFLEDLIMRTNQTIKDLECKLLENGLEAITSSDLEDLHSRLFSLNEKLQEISLKRNENLEDLRRIKSKLAQNKSLLQRFEILEKQYLSDIERLKFLLEGSYFFDLLSEEKCIHCGTELTEDRVINIIDSESSNKAYISEIQKIEHSLTGLEKAKKDLTVYIKLLNNELIKIKLEDAEQEKLIKNFSSLAQSLREELFYKEEEIQLINTRQCSLEKLIEYNDEKEILKTQLQSTNKRKSEEINYLDVISDSGFREILYQTLKEWDIEGVKNKSDISFYYASRNKLIDFKINSKERASFGKGYRAILHSALIVSLLKYCVVKQLPHPGVLIIDSPVTAFKDKDNVSYEGELNMDKQKKFFENLYEVAQDYQIIIIENKEPPNELKDKINYVEFTKLKSIGREGFF